MRTKKTNRERMRCGEKITKAQNYPVEKNGERKILVGF
jgi:hypothetical protein